jgi:hypothetical protein
VQIDSCGSASERYHPPSIPIHQSPSKSQGHPKKQRWLQSPWRFQDGNGMVDHAELMKHLFPKDYMKLELEGAWETPRFHQQLWFLYDLWLGPTLLIFSSPFDWLMYWFLHP